MTINDGTYDFNTDLSSHFDFWISRIALHSPYADDPAAILNDR